MAFGTTVVLLLMISDPGGLFTAMQSVLGQNVASCRPLPAPVCYGAQMPYTTTTLDEDKTYAELRSSSFYEETERLRYHPECWAELAPVVCGLRNPKCDNGIKQQLPQTACKRLNSACRLVLDQVPETIKNCSDGRLYAQKGEEVVAWEELRHLNYTEGQCPAPLNATRDRSRYYDGVAGCGVGCHDPFLSSEDQDVFRNVMLTMVIICMVLNGFGMSHASRRDFRRRSGFGTETKRVERLWTICLLLLVVSPFNPDKCAMMMSISFFVSSFGYLLSFFPHVRDLTTCSDDGLRLQVDHHARGIDRIGLCMFTFVLTYVFTLSGFIWFGHLMFACYLDFQKIINSHKRAKANLFTLTRSSYIFFHGTGVALPAVVAIAVVFLQAVEGNNLLGVCWTTPLNSTMTIAFVLAPFAIVLVIALVFIVLYWLNLRRSQLSQFGTLKTQRDVLRRLRFVGSMCVFILFFHIFQLGGLWCVVYNLPGWRVKLSEFLLCQMTSLSDAAATGECAHIVQSVRNSYLGAHYAHIVSYFSTGLTISMWTWNAPNFRRWKRLITGQRLSEEHSRERLDSTASWASSNRMGTIERSRSRNSTRSRQSKDGIESLLSVPIPAQAFSTPEDMGPIAKTFQRDSIFPGLKPFMHLVLKVTDKKPGKKISSVADFSQLDRLNNWQDEARRIRLTRTKSQRLSRTKSQFFDI